MWRIPLHSQFSAFQPECGEFSALFSVENNAENSPHYGWVAENWECGDVLRVISVLWLKCGNNAEISPHSCPNTPIRIFSAFPLHFFPYKNAEISPRSCPNTPIRIFSTFPPHFFPHFLHIRMWRFLRVPVRILPSAFSPQGKCGDLGYGCLTHWGWDKMADTFQATFSDAFSWMKIYESRLTFFPKLLPQGPINTIPVLVQIMAWHQPGDVAIRYLRD